MAETQVATHHESAITSTNKVLRNTYMLLSMTLVFSAMMAGVSIMIGAPYFGFLITLGGFFGLFYAVHKTQNSTWGLFWTFALTGFMGFTLGPILNYYLTTTNGTSIIMQAMGLTGFIFFSLSGYVLVSKKDFSFLGGFLFTGLLVVIGAALLAFGASFFGYYVSGLHLAISAAIVLIMSGYILFDTSRIIHGGETNYIMATISLYVNIYNLFASLLHLLGAVGDD